MFFRVPAAAPVAAVLILFFCRPGLPALRAQKFELRDPLNILEEVVPLPYTVGLLLPGLAVTGALLLTSVDSADTTVKMVDAGNRFFYSHAGWYLSYHASQTDVLEGTFGFGVDVGDWMTVGAELNLVRLRDERIGTQGGGGRLFVQWAFLNEENVSLYFEQGLGIVYYFDEFPPGGTRFNFTPVYGLGGKVLVRPESAIIFSIRHYHISNGGLVAGLERNPGFDSNGLYVGYSFAR